MPGCVAASSNPEDYDFGFEHVDVEEYQRVAIISYTVASVQPGAW